MNISKKIKLLCAINDITVCDLSEKMGHTKQNLYQKLFRNRFKVSDLEKIAEILNCDVEVNFISKNGEKII